MVFLRVDLFQLPPRIRIFSPAAPPYCTPHMLVELVSLYVQSVHKKKLQTHTQMLIPIHAACVYVYVLGEIGEEYFALLNLAHERGQMDLVILYLLLYLLLVHVTALSIITVLSSFRRRVRDDGMLLLLGHHSTTTDPKPSSSFPEKSPTDTIKMRGGGGLELCVCVLQNVGIYDLSELLDPRRGKKKQQQQPQLQTGAAKPAASVTPPSTTSKAATAAAVLSLAFGFKSVFIWLGRVCSVCVTVSIWRSHHQPTTKPHTHDHIPPPLPFLSVWYSKDGEIGIFCRYKAKINWISACILQLQRKSIPKRFNNILACFVVFAYII